MKYIMALLLFSFLMARGQKEDLVQLHGYVQDQHEQPVPYVHIFNTNSKRITITDDNGVYTLLAKPKDTIKVSCIGYKTKYYQLQDSVESVLYSKDFILITDTLELSEYTVYPWANFQDFKQAFLNLEVLSSEEENAITNIKQLMRHINTQYGIQPDPGISYRIASNQHYNRNFKYKYQTPTSNLLNPFAWAQFFEAVKKGDYNFREDQ